MNVYEIFYSDGGHAGPFKTHLEATIAAQRHLEGIPADRRIGHKVRILDYENWSGDPLKCFPAEEVTVSVNAYGEQSSYAIRQLGRCNAKRSQ